MQLLYCNKIRYCGKMFGLRNLATGREKRRRQLTSVSTPSSFWRQTCRNIGVVDTRKVPVKNYVTGRWVPTPTRKADGTFVERKARWVLRGFQDTRRFGQPTDNPTGTRPGFRLVCQLAASEQWHVGHIDLKTAFLQGADGPAALHGRAPEES